MTTAKSTGSSNRTRFGSGLLEQVVVALGQVGVRARREVFEEFVDAMEEGTEQLLESSHTIEDQTVENVGELSTQLREQLEQTQEMQDELEDQLERQSGDVEQLLERQAEQIQLQFEEANQKETKTQTDPEHTLEDIDGIDSTTREQLSDAGIATIDDLTRSDPETVAEAAEVSTSRARGWIDQAEA